MRLSTVLSGWIAVLRRVVGGRPDPNRRTGADRRSGLDRRVTAGDPPGGVERRAGADRRSGRDRRAES